MANELEDLLEKASRGDRSAAEAFFVQLFDATLCVPDRYQTRSILDEPDYPNDLVSVLGINDDDRVIVPVFTRQELVEKWSGTALNVSEIKGSTLFSRIPEDWWLAVNPAAEFEKEISPWELTKLKEGKESIAEIVDEIFSEGVQPIRVHPVTENEYETLQNDLPVLAGEIDDLEQIYLLREEYLTPDNDLASRALIGLKISSSDKNRIKEIIDSVTETARKAQIGDDAVTISTKTKTHEDVLFGVFKAFEPLYTSNVNTRSTLLSSLLDRILVRGNKG